MPILTDSEPSQLPHDERISFYNHEVQRLTKDLGSYLTAHQEVDRDACITRVLSEKVRKILRY